MENRIVTLGGMSTSEALASALRQKSHPKLSHRRRMERARAPLQHAEYMAMRRFPYLDGLRAAAVLLVFTAHVAWQDFWKHFHGGAGVSLFFVISGFIITTLLLREADGKGRIDVGGFYIRRTFRIYPTYFAILAAYCVMVLLLHIQGDRTAPFQSALPFYVLGFPEVIQLMEGTAPPFSGAWSIGIEEKYYLIWPVLGFVFLARSNTAKLIALAAMALLFAASGIWYPLLKVVQPYSIIAFGAMVAVVLHNPRTYKMLAWAGQRWVLAPTMIMTAAVTVIEPSIQIGWPLYLPYGLLCAVLLAAVVTTKAQRPVRWLAARPVAYLGVISYVFYLTHGLTLNAVEALFPKSLGEAWLSVAQVVIGLPLVILVGWFIHRFFEAPINKFGQRLAKKRAVRKIGRSSSPTPPREETA